MSRAKAGSDSMRSRLAPKLPAWMGSPTGFKIVCPDAAMEPKVHEGASVEFTCGVEPRRGDGILVRDSQGALWVRRYYKTKHGTWFAIAENRLYRSFKSDRDGLEILAVLTGINVRLSDRPT